MARYGAIRHRLRGMLLPAALALGLSACATISENHGFVPSDEELALIEVGRDTRETVAATVGRPSASGLLNDVGWFYVQSHWERRGAFAPKEVDREVVSITFTEEGVVENVERFGLEDGKVVAISRRVTQPNIKGLSALRQIFGALGRISASNIVD